MNPTNLPWWLRALVAVILPLVFVGVLAALGWAVRGVVADREIADLKTSWAATEKSRAEAQAATLTDAQQRGDLLARQLNDLSNTLTLFAEEKNREISRLATGRRCLDADLVRVLNHSTPASQSGGAVSEAAGQPVRTAAATAADPDDGRFATDADIAGWANTCRTRYDACRGRLDAIGQFYGEPQDGR